MNFQFVDLSETYAERLPQGAQVHQGKFVQIRHDQRGEILIVASRQLCIYHAQIVDLFCQAQSPTWAFDLNAKQDAGELYEDDAKVIGGGYFDISPERKRLTLSGQSMAFGDYDSYDLDKRVQSIERFKDYRVFC
jgi:hypothetical protein